VRLGSLKTTITLGTADCGGANFVPPPAPPFSGQLDVDGTLAAPLGLGCLYVGSAAALLPGARIPDGSSSYLDVAGVNGSAITATASVGTGPATCTLGAGPDRICLNGAPGSNGAGACTTDADCGAVRACDLRPNCYFGAPVPVQLGAASTCIMNAIATDVCAQSDLLTRQTTITSASLAAHAYLTGDGASPCPRCVAGTCTSGQRAGLPCSGGVGSLQTTIECPPDAARFAGTIGVDLSGLSTGSSTLVADANELFCPGQRIGGAFGVAADRITEHGSPLLGGPNLFSLTLAGTFCIPSSGSGLFNSVAGIPGPGAVAVPATEAVCLVPDRCLNLCNPCRLGGLCSAVCNLCRGLCVPS
jgi:hypothetical protein